MKNSDLFYVVLLGAGVYLWYTRTQQQAAAAAQPPSPIVSALGPTVDAVTKLLNGMFTGQTDSLLGGRAPVGVYYSVPASNQLATYSLAPPSPDPKQWYDAVQGA
jgi:hypothetical protein